MFDGRKDTLAMESKSFVASMAFAVSNACANPFIYAFVNDSIKKGLIETFTPCHKICRMKSSVITPEETLAATEANSMSLTRVTNV